MQRVRVGMIERVNKVDECVMTVEHASWCEQRCGTMRMAEQDGEDVLSEGGRRDVRLIGIN